MKTYENFSQAALRAMDLANEEAKRRNAVYLRPEYILLGIIQEEHFLQAVWRWLQIDPRELRKDVAESLQVNAAYTAPDVLPLTAASTRIVYSSLLAAQAENLPLVDPGHILLALREAQFVPLEEVFVKFNITPERILSAIAETRQSTPVAIPEADPLEEDPTL